ncbi:MAG TPA: class I SAM-dependent methyltransferase [Solirubrobacteraceae bacterium]|jgi:ubiquinone/menaquinone biosynthesis C-methylase UbiE|nr:class I SAM-dependent methyltransferase [Solirubrobacteraceae bacterium]
MSVAADSRSEALKREVRRYWEAEPCGSAAASAREGTREYYEQVERRRYELEPFIHRYARFASTAGQEVLEIGVGLGTDHVQFARAGAELHGIDLTQRGIELVGRRLALEGLSSDLRVADAEALPFADDSFDVVYSWGVLHHTPDTPRAFAEAVRVTRPGGRVCIMVYSRHAWVTYGLWLRRGPFSLRLRRSLADVLYHHMESLGTKGFTKRELRTMLDGIVDLQIEKVATPYDRAYAGPLTRWTGGLLGFFQVAQGRKPGVSRS